MFRTLLLVIMASPKYLSGRLLLLNNDLALSKEVLLKCSPFPFHCRVHLRVLVFDAFVDEALLLGLVLKAGERMIGRLE
jgi:hypothetical protein